MKLNDSETEQMVRELARITGETEEEAIAAAVRERLSRVKKHDSLAERMLAIGRDCASRLKEPYKSKTHSSLMYGDDGLPR